MTIFLSLLSTFLIIVSAFSLGSLVWICLFRPYKPSFIFELSIGLALLSYLLLAFASLGMLNQLTVLMILVPLSIITLVYKSKHMLVAVDSIKNNFSKINKRWERIACSIIFLLLVFAVIEAMAPATTEDTLSYHFRIPYDYVANGGLVYSPFQPYNMPHLVQMLLTVPILLGAGDLGSHLVNFIFCILFVSAMFQLADHYFDRKTALLAVVLILSTPMFTYIKVSGRVEVGLTALILIGIWSMLNGLNDHGTKRYRWIFASGMFMGIACGIKYYGLFAATVAFLLATIIFFRQSGWSVTLKVLTSFSLGVLLFGWPFYIKNLVMTGNPLFPAMFDLFGGRDWSTEMAHLAKTHFDAYKRPAGDGIINLFLSPWRLTVDGEPFNAGRTGYGFVYLALFPILLWALIRKVKKSGLSALLPNRSTCSVLSWFVILLWILWFTFAFQRGRHLLPVFAMLSILTGRTVLVWLMCKKRGAVHVLIKYCVTVILVGGISFQVLISGYFTKTFIPVAFRYEKRDAFMDRICPMWRDYQNVNHTLPQDSKVLHLFGDRQYYLKREQFYPSPYFQGWLDWARIPDVQTYRKQLMQAGFTHVIGYSHEVYFDNTKRTTVDLKIDNIVRFNELNAQLLTRYTNKLYENIFSIPNSRTLPSKKIKKTFVLYELI
jgi:hypothetical protein